MTTASQSSETEVVLPDPPRQESRPAPPSPPSLDAAFSAALRPAMDLLKGIERHLELSERSASAQGAPHSDANGQGGKIIDCLTEIQQAQQAQRATLEKIDQTLSAIAEQQKSPPIAGSSLPDTAPVEQAASGAPEASLQEPPGVAGQDEQEQEVSEPPFPQVGAQPEPAPPDDRWERVVLGDELCDNAALDEPRQKLLEQALEGNIAARALLAQIMLVQSASKEQLPKLLKEVGEAYYEWQPKTTPDEPAWERELVKWLHDRIKAAGLRNSIELVHVGDRYDTQRHTTNDRGVEVAEVRGWVVMRDGGKALHKAQVVVK